jgi:hypothetical protein
MNGFIKRTMFAAWLGSVAAISGCCGCGDKPHLSDCYDTCWLQRYSFQADQSVNAAFGAQVNNGHILDQTVMTYEFEPGTANLTPGGVAHLECLASRRPAPDPHVFLQSALDVPYDPAAPNNSVAARQELNAKRVESIQRFLTAETAGRPVVFDVVVHAAPTPGLPAPPLGIATTHFYNGFRGALTPGTIGTGPSGGPPTGQLNNVTGGGTGR